MRGLGQQGGRVLVVTNDFPPRLGGIERLVHQLCGDLPPDRVVVHTSSTPGDRAYDRNLPYPVVRDPARMLLPTRAVRRRVVETFQRHGCHRVVFGASAPLGLLGPALRDAGAEHIQALTHGHEVWWAALPGTRQLLRRIGDSTDDLTYVSEYCRDRIAPALSPAARTRFRRYEHRGRPRALPSGLRGSRGARCSGHPGRRSGGRLRRSARATQGSGHVDRAVGRGAGGRPRRVAVDRRGRARPTATPGDGTGRSESRTGWSSVARCPSSTCRHTSTRVMSLRCRLDPAGSASRWRPSASSISKLKRAD